MRCRLQQLGLIPLSCSGAAVLLPIPDYSRLQFVLDPTRSASALCRDDIRRQLQQLRLTADDLQECLMVSSARPPASGALPLAFT